MRRVRYKPRWQSLSSTLRMMVLMTLAGGLIVGCADKPTYEVDFDQSFPFAQYKTYRWYDDDHNSRESQYRRYNSSDQRVRNTASQELMQRGFRECPRTIRFLGELSRHQASDPENQRSGAGDAWWRRGRHLRSVCEYRLLLGAIRQNLRRWHSCI